SSRIWEVTAPSRSAPWGSRSDTARNSSSSPAGRIASNVRRYSATTPVPSSSIRPNPVRIADNRKNRSVRSCMGTSSLDAFARLRADGGQECRVAPRQVRDALLEPTGAVELLAELEMIAVVDDRAQHAVTCVLQRRDRLVPRATG